MSFPTLAVVSPYKKGKNVAEAQQLLANNEFGKFYSGVIDAEYGPLTGAAAHRAKYWLGYATHDIDNHFGDMLHSFLLKSGTPGAKRLPPTFVIRRTLRQKAAAQHAKSLTLGQKAFAYAKTFEGYRETANNQTEFGQWYKLDGNPWCAMFTSFCIDHAGGLVHYAYVPSVVADARAGRNGLFITHAPKQGDLVCYDWNHDGTFDHVGFFDKWIEEGTSFATIEGNTLPEGGAGNQSNGGGVYARKRYTGEANIAFVRYHG